MGRYVKLLPCKCGGRPKVERFCGWWHIECPKCGHCTKEPMGCTVIWGYNSRREAAEAWNKDVSLIILEKPAARHVTYDEGVM